MPVARTEKRGRHVGSKRENGEVERWILQTAKRNARENIQATAQRGTFAECAKEYH
ncbi:MAG: hypothetical protein V7606_4004, partial [Burkholderiales bacterium]